MSRSSFLFFEDVSKYVLKFYPIQFSATEEAGVPSRVPDEESKAKRIETLESHLLEAQSEIRNLTLVAEKAELAKKEADANFIALKAKYSKAQEKLVWAYEVMQNMFANYKLFDADMQRSSKGKCCVLI